MNPLLFSITYKCNLSCRYCGLKNCRPEPDMERCLKLIETHPCDWVLLTGGEPFLVPDLKEICLKIRSFGKKVGVTTNGTIHNYDIIQHVDRLGVSLDGGREKTDLYRGVGTFDSAMNFLANCVGRVETVLMATTNDAPAETEAIANDLGVDYLQITRFEEAA